jgi:hypothetical protein
LAPQTVTRERADYFIRAFEARAAAAKTDNPAMKERLLKLAELLERKAHESSGKKTIGHD